MQSTNVCTLVRTHHKHHSAPNSCFLSKSEDANMTQLKASKKMRRRKDAVLKQELHSTCITESHSIKGCSCVCSSSTVMKKTKLSSSRQNLARCESRSFLKKNSSAIFQAKKVESIAYKSFQEPEAVNPVAPSQSSNAVDPVTIFHVTERHCELPSRQISFPGTPEVHKEDSFVDGNIMAVKELPATNYCKEKMCSAVMAEKCNNVGVNNFSECSNLGQFGSQLEALKLADESLPLEGFKGQKSFCSPHLPPYPVEVDHSLARMSGDEISIKKSELIDTCTPKINCYNTATNGIPCELKNPVLFNSASDMVNVFQAANDAYRVQLASEAIQSITGSPIAEFEKFISSASAVLYGALDTNNCKECSPLHAFNAPLCEDETPNLALGNIWRWYEKHGACGMEVRAMDHEHSVRLGMDQFGFRAYFVPYLSAVQLFRKCKAHTNGTDVCSQETGSGECSSTVRLTSILRKLVPQPCSVNSSTFSKTSQVAHKEASFASMNNKIYNECKAHTNDTDVCSQETDSREYSSPVGLTSILRKLVPQPCSVDSTTFSKTSQVPHKEASFASMNNKINNNCEAHTTDIDVCSQETGSRECSSTIGLTSILQKLVPQPCSVNSSIFSKTSQGSMNSKINNKCKAHTNDTDVCTQETASRECSSTVGLTYMLQKLVPQPCSVSSSTFSNTSHVPNKAASFASMNNTINNKQSNLKSTDGMELLFEYFEYDQPQQRRPLFEMIKELSNGHIPLKSRVHGDPRTLDSLGLNDLHRNSWYSVAWYPIYRIPDGKLSAAFLTYHSLGHLVRRSPKHDSHSMEFSIVSPVVGLQCYNAQGECWFNPRKPTGLKTSSRIDADSSHILKERIRTLEQTASVMARATVTAGGQTYVNRQPDYEFFLSRRC